MSQAETRLVIKNGFKGDEIVVESANPHEAIESALDYWGDEWQKKMGDRAVVLRKGYELFETRDWRNWRDLGVYPHEVLTLIPDPCVS